MREAKRRGLCLSCCERQRRANMTPEQRAERLRKQRESIARYKDDYMAHRRKPEVRRRAKDYDRFIKTGFYPALVEVLRQAYSGKCAICSVVMLEDPDRKGRYNDECADHCHSTNTPRGLICRACNLALAGYERSQREAGLVVPAYDKYLSEPPAQRIDVLQAASQLLPPSGDKMPRLQPGPRRKQKRIGHWMTSRNASGYRGVSWHRKTENWQVSITHEGKTHFLGLHASKVSAAIAYTIGSVALKGFDGAHYNDVFSGEVPA